MLYLRPASTALLENIWHKSRKVLFQQQRLNKARERFYKNVSITRSVNDTWEINLDQKKLRTPLGKAFQVPNEQLALAVAEEWNAQLKNIEQAFMHLTGLCNTVLDNPARKTSDDIVKQLLSYLESDTLCYVAEKESDLYDIQQREWGPIMNWFRNYFKIEVTPTASIEPPDIPQTTHNIIHNYLHTYNFWSLTGILYGVESLKSLILMTALIERVISVETAVTLARLEAEFQTSLWGRVEWAHDIEQYELQARVAAATCFVRVNSYQEKVVKKSGMS